MSLKRHIVWAFTIVMVCFLGGTYAVTAAEPLRLGLSGAPNLGSDNAPVTLVEFSNFECFYCRRHAVQIYPLLVENYVKTGKLRYVVRELSPKDTDSIGFKAAEAALCAGDQDRYWDMRSVLFENQDTLSVEGFVTLAFNLGLEPIPFETCLAEHRHRERILSDRRRGIAAGINAVPAFFLGVTDGEDSDRLRVLKTISGSKIYNVYADAIDGLLQKANAKGD